MVRLWQMCWREVLKKSVTTAKKKVIETSQCVKCKANYHPSCFGRVGSVKYDGKLVCCQQAEKSEVSQPKQRKKSENYGISLTEMDENKIKTIIKQAFNQYLPPFESKMEKKFNDLERCVQFMSDSFDDLKKKFDDVISQTKELRKENIMLKEKVQALEIKFDELEVKERADNIIIGGVPKQPEENTGTVVHKILTAMDIQGHIKCVESFRLGQGGNGPILAKFSDREMKKCIVNEIRRRKGLKLGECDLVYRPTERNNKIYLNDDLPINKRNLFKKVRDFRKEKNFKSAFCTNGVIYLKKNDKDPAIKIRSEGDLE